MKKILSVLLAMLLLVGCVGCHNQPVKREFTAEEKEVEQAVVAFFECMGQEYETFDDFLNEMENHADLNGTIMQNIQVQYLFISNPIPIEEGVRVRLNQEARDSMMTKMIHLMYGKAFAYDVQDISINGDEATATVQMSTVSPDVIMQKLNADSMMSVMEPWLLENYPQCGSFEEFNALAQNFSAEEKQESFDKFTTDCMDDIMHLMATAVEENAGVNRTTGTNQFTLKKIDGKWIVQ